jgi:hypothetical protein
MVLVSGKNIALKQKLYSSSIVSYSESFSQINESQIMNHEYLSYIDAQKNWIFRKPYNNESKMFVVKRTYLKQLKQKLTII